jgi:thiopeptide-type bacteriocin biosynthesis protein
VDQLAARALERGLAYDAQLGTYEREIERYGGPKGIVIAERLFHADSDAVVALLAMFERGAAGLDERWRIGALGSEALMRDLGLDDEARIAQARRIHAAFEVEFRADARLRKQVAARVRAEQASVAELVAATSADDHPLAPGIGVLAERSARIEPLAAELAELRAAGRLELPLEQLAGSCVHMWLDRLCRTENRFHEYVTYALLTRVLQARAARQRAQN